MAVAVALVVALLAGVTGLLLARAYRPTIAGLHASPFSSEVHRAAATRRWHQGALQALGMAGPAAAALAALMIARTGRNGWKRVIGLIGAPAAALASLAAAATLSSVEWGALALWEPTPANDVAGFWFAAFDDRVRFVLMDGSELSQHQYAFRVVVHLTLPGVVVLALAGANVPLLSAWDESR